MVFQEGDGKQTTTPPERRDSSSSALSIEELTSLYSLLQDVLSPLSLFHDVDQTGHVDFPARQYQYQHQHQDEEVQPALVEPRRMFRRRTQPRTGTSSNNRSTLCELIDFSLELIGDDNDLLPSSSSEDDAARAEEEEDDLQEWTLLEEKHPDELGWSTSPAHYSR